MISVITGDIIKSRAQKNPEIWIRPLKKALLSLEKDTTLWEVYRGDSFQLEMLNVEESFKAALYIKACIKMVKGLDVRLSIGIGTKTYQGDDVTESNGEAFIFSGVAFESLKLEKQNLRIKSKNEELNKELNLYFSLASTFMDNWTTNSAEIVKLSLENPQWLQQELANYINTSQNAVSKRQKRAYWQEIQKLNAMYKQKIKQLL